MNYRMLESLNHAWNLIHESASQPPPLSTMTMLTMSGEAQTIAQALANVAHLQVGAEPRRLSELTQPMREEFRRKAELAIDRLDPRCYEPAVDAAVEQTLEWLNGPPSGGIIGPVTQEDILRECLSRFLALASRPRVQRIR